MGSDIQTLIANVGFPIAISMYLLIRIEAKLLTLSDSINELSKNINVMCIKQYIMDNNPNVNPKSFFHIFSINTPLY